MQYEGYSQSPLYFHWEMYEIKTVSCIHVMYAIYITIYDLLIEGSFALCAIGQNKPPSPPYNYFRRKKTIKGFI